ncbi:acyl CoA:acetate/3-ketoacid CoA transferase [Paradesulfitobacterium aromaticivorans]
MKNKVITAEQAAELVKDNDLVAVSGFVSFCYPEEVVIALKQRFLKTGNPKNLGIMCSAGPGDRDDGPEARGNSHFGYEGFVRKLIVGHVGLAPRVANMVGENKVEGYNLPQGVICDLYRAIAAKRPGVVTRVGLNTFVDPRQQGARWNSISKDEMVQLIKINNEELLFFKYFPINVAIIRATTADEKGNLTTEREPMHLELLAMAMAAHNSNGIVIAQVDRLVKAGSLNPKQVRVPGILVDAIVVVQDEKNLRMSCALPEQPGWSGDIKVPINTVKPLPLNAKKIIARRAALELYPDAIVNLGVGIPADMAMVLLEEGCNDFLTMTVESGTIGGVPYGGLGLGAAINADSYIDQPYMFDFYDGGGLTHTFVGFAQVDCQGNVNVSKFGKTAMGAGGFIDLTQNAKKVVFCGQMNAGSSEIEINNGQMCIKKDGTKQKFMDQIEQITFNAKLAVQKGQPVIFVTERCVFELTEEGLVVTEIAPGVDLEKDILAQMNFVPVISKDLKLMDSALFKPEPMGLKARWQTC